MKPIDLAVLRDVLLLSFAAGSADAAGWMGLGRVFTANMTGNVVLLGMFLGQGQFATAARSVFVLVLFMFGVAAGTRLDRGVAPKDWPRLARRIITVEKVSLILFALAWTLALHRGAAADYGLLALLGFAMGMQSAAMSRLGAPGVGTTALTSTVTTFVTGVVTRATDPVAGPRVSFAFPGGVLALYGLGAACAGLLIATVPWLAGWLPIAAALWVWPRPPAA
ncbi:MAG: YoaK family protein [Verrucomicrobiota bacterium]